MEGERTARALSRIEAAAARIESAAGRPVQAPAPGGNPELERKYAVLRSEAGAALQELERLIGTLDR